MSLVYIGESDLAKCVAPYFSSGIIFDKNEWDTIQTNVTWLSQYIIVVGFPSSLPPNDARAKSTCQLWNFRNYFWSVLKLIGLSKISGCWRRAGEHSFVTEYRSPEGVGKLGFLAESLPVTISWKKKLHCFTPRRHSGHSGHTDRPPGNNSPWEEGEKQLAIITSEYETSMGEAIFKHLDRRGPVLCNLCYVVENWLREKASLHILAFAKVG